ncbi:hypothetical protein PGH42_05780 [Legionella pneumophila]|nr:hypothetical protein PGH42_05780 [Legionella pneumophila]
MSWFLVCQLQQRKKITVYISWVDSTTTGIYHYSSGTLKKRPQVIGRGRKGVGTKIHVALSAEKIQGACLSVTNIVDMKSLLCFARNVIGEVSTIMLLIKSFYC